MGDRMASDPLPVVHKCFSLEISWGGGGEGTTYVESEEKKEAGYLEEKMKRVVSGRILQRRLAFHSDAPQHPGLLSPRAVGWPSVWGRDWGSEWMGKRELGNRWEGGGLLSPERAESSGAQEGCLQGPRTLAIAPAPLIKEGMQGGNSSQTF